MEKVILMIDSNLPHLLVYKKLLSGTGICEKIILARSGNEALSILRSQKVDLILTALRLPIMNGFQLAERIRHPNSPDEFKNKSETIRIIILGADIPPDNLPPTITAYIETPVSKEIFIEKIKENLFFRPD